MNYIRNQYPFKFIRSIIRMASQKVELLHYPVGLKRNNSDSALNKKISKPIIKIIPNNVRKTASADLKYSNLEKKSSVCTIRSSSSNNSVSLSKTSSEHSLRNSLIVEKPPRTDPKPKCNSTNLRSFTSEVHEKPRSKLKRAYPWQNFNLNSVESSKKSSSKYYIKPNVRSSVSDDSLLSPSNSDLSMRSSRSSIKRDRSTDSLQEIRDQMPFFKSILKKSRVCSNKPVKEVTFNNISTIYGSKSPYSTLKQSKTQSLTNAKPVIQMKKIPETTADGGDGSNKVKNEQVCVKCLKKQSNSQYMSGRYEQVKEENSFLYLYNGKRPKTAH